MGELRFFFGTMNCGKSTLALQMHHNATAAGQHVLLYTKHDRHGAVITSRLGLEQPGRAIDDATDVFGDVAAVVRSGAAVDGLICDEAQFLTGAQVEQLARLADEMDLDVRAFGLLSDFQTRLFPGSRRLMELADHREELQLEARCWCGAPGTHNARTVDGHIVRAGAQVVVGDVTGPPSPGAPQQQHLLEDAVAYEVLCRAHHRAGTTRRMADQRAEQGTGPGPTA